MKHAHTSRAELPDAVYLREIRRALPALAWTFGESLNVLEPEALSLSRDAGTLEQVWPLLKRVRSLLESIQGEQELDDRPGALCWVKRDLTWNRHQLAQALEELNRLGSVPRVAPPSAPGTPRGSAAELIGASGGGVPGVGKQWKQVLEEAEEYVKKHGWPGMRVLARALECAPATIRKATDHSPYLKAREAEHKARRRRGRTVGLSEAVLKTTAAADDPEATLRRLMIESARDNADDPGPIARATPSVRPRQRR